jgi:tetratricopeptide repeat protein
MKTTFYVSAAALALAALTSCNGKLGALSADNFTVTPSPLETVGDDVPATINGRFPQKYMKKKAVVTVIPELRYAGIKTVGQPATFQGEKVVGNDQTVSYKLGGNYVMKANFPYNFLMQMGNSELYLTFDARVGKKAVNIPAVKVADGIIATSQLVYLTLASANTATAADGFQREISRQQNAQIKYLISQAKVRTSELNTTSVKDFIKILRDIKADQKSLALDNVEVSAYASPDGALRFNTGLAENRKGSAEKYVNDQLKKTKLNTNVDAKYTAEDWDGFQELVAASNIQDKEVILRVLSMYKDPEEREQQIKNLSVAFRELANEVLPELRRARLTVNYRVIGRSDDEIRAQYAADASKLSVEELLYAATLTKDAAERKAIFTKAAQLYPQDKRAYNGLAQLAYAEGNLTDAQNALNQAAGLPEANANAALLALRQGNVNGAEALLGKALTAGNYNEVLGNLQIARGNYAQAAQNFKGINTNSAALAQILNKDYVAAAQTLAAVPNADAITDYLKAVLAAHTGQVEQGAQALRAAIAKNANIRDLASKDLVLKAIYAALNR